ncbi:MAG: EF-hand domain-containing protein [Pirellulales bacterium]
MTDSPANESAAAAAEAPKLRLGRVLGVVLPLGAVIAGAFWFWGYYDGANKIREWMLPERVTATGQVYFGDEPLSGGEVYTEPTTPGLAGAAGYLDQEGKFTFKMDIKGDLREAIFVGEHKVIVRKTDPKSQGGARAPDLLTPNEFADFSTTPLTISVAPSPATNHFELRVPKPSGATTGGEAGPSSGGPTAEGGRPAPPTPAEAAQALLTKHDQDGDGKLSPEEARAVAGSVGTGLQSADANQDGGIDVDEIAQIIGELERSNALFRAKGIPSAPGKAPSGE